MEEHRREDQNQTGLHQVLIDQYRWHEIQHHFDLPMDGPGLSTTPIAHSLVDIYKLLHQGEFGLGHLIGNPYHFKDNLAREFFRGSPLGQEPLLEKVAADGETFRLNLRPLRLAFAGEEDQVLADLFQLCLSSAELKTGDHQHFLSTLEIFSRLNEAGEIKVRGVSFIFLPATVDHFLLEIREHFSAVGDLPILSHSPDYRQLNHPSYRVVELAALRNSPLAGLIPQ